MWPPDHIPPRTTANTKPADIKDEFFEAMETAASEINSQNDEYVHFESELEEEVEEIQMDAENYSMSDSEATIPIKSHINQEEQTIKDGYNLSPRGVEPSQQVWTPSINNNASSKANIATTPSSSNV